MATPQPKITLSRSRDIPFDKLVLSQRNVRSVKTGQSIEELAEDIARRTLLQSLNVRPILGDDGQETGLYEVPAGGRRYRALELLVKQKRLAKNAPVPCVIRTDGIAEEDSLAENTQRLALHPLDQFRAFTALRKAGLGDEEIAARFFVTPAVVRQRLKLAAVSPRLLELYAEDRMSLDQLMAFTVTDDHARQEAVWDGLANSYNKEAYVIRRQLTEGAVRASDKRVRFVGLDKYEAAGGLVLRDLFQEDGGGWLQDPALLNRLASEALDRAAATVRAEGWKWVEAAIEFAYGHAQKLRRLTGTAPPLTETEQAEVAALTEEYRAFEEAYAGADELPDEVDRRMGEIERTLDALEHRCVYEPDAMARAGAFVSLGGDGELRIERGFVRREDETGAPPAGEDDTTLSGGTGGEIDGVKGSKVTIVSVTGGDTGDGREEEEDGVRPLPERLLTELTAHRTLALRDALANDPDTAFLAMLHALCLRCFYRFFADSCLEINATSAALPTQAPGLADSPPAKAIAARHDQWAAQLPEDSGELWDLLVGFDADSRAALFAHCVGLTVNALHDPWRRPSPRIAHADQIAGAVGLDMVAAGWAPTAANYLGRVPKARILEAVREAKGDAAVQLIEHLRKLDMANEAERLLAGAGWLPETLRAPLVPRAGWTPPETVGPEAESADALPAFLVETAA